MTLVTIMVMVMLAMMAMVAMMVIMDFDNYFSNLIARTVVFLVVSARGKTSRAIPQSSHSLARFGRGARERLHRAA